MKINTMLHMKLNSAVSVFAVAAAFSVLLPTSAYCGVCFLPDCGDDNLAGGGGNMNMNEDSAFCESNGFTYYADSKCPQYYADAGKCSRDDHYLKCDAAKWCKQNGYNTTSCSIPKYVDTPCPSDGSLYKQCKTDNPRACRDTGYTNSCPSGQKLKKNSGRCSYDNSYGTCCKPSGCPAHTSLTSSSYGTNGTDGCEYTCYYTCNMNCPSGTSTSNPGGCGGSTRNGCNTKNCYYPYQSCCTPKCSDEHGCSCGTTSVSDGCGGTCTKCKSCCNRYSSNWCSVHSTCHGDCCSDGSIKPCDTRCGGSGCSTGDGDGGTGGSSSCSGYSSCSTECTGVTNTTPHCQNRYNDGSGYNYIALVCNLNISRTRVTCNGQTETDGGIAYEQLDRWSTGNQTNDIAACEAKRKNTTCVCSSYRWPYNC